MKSAATYDRFYSLKKPTIAAVEGYAVAGGLELDLVARSVRVGHAERSLSEREFGLLRCLAEQSGHVVTRERLLAGDFIGDLEQLWQAPAPALPLATGADEAARWLAAALGLA